MKKICIFCGSRFGQPSQLYRDMAVEIGNQLAQHHLELVYGGASVGLMGLIADTVLEKGGHVTGIIPRSMLLKELAHPQIQELKVVDSMHERKFLMYELSDAFVVLPGGIGTLDEFFEIFTWRQLEYHEKPIALFNYQGFYDPLIKHLEHSVKSGFLDKENLDLIHVADNFGQLLNKWSTVAQ